MSKSSTRALPAVEDLTAAPITPSRVDLTWRPVRGATAYNVYRDIYSDFVPGEKFLVAAVKDAAWIDRNLSAETRYFYRVAAVRGGREGPTSRVVEGATPRHDLRLTHQGNLLTVASDAFEACWDLADGGEIVQLRQYDGDSWVSLLPEGRPAMRYEFQSGSVAYSLSGVAAKVDVRKAASEEICFALTAFPRNTDGREASLEVRQVFHVFREGWIFCHLRMLIPRWRKPFTITRAAMSITLDKQIAGAGKCAWSYFDRLSRVPHTWQKPTDRIDAPALYPYVSVDWGLNKQTSFTNHTAMLLEDWCGFGGKERTAVKFGGGSGGRMQFEWALHDGPAVTMKVNDSYQNCWGIGLGAARKGWRQEVGAGQGNNMTGLGYWHYNAPQQQGVPVGQEAEDWPWHTFPLRWQKRLAAGGAPSDEMIDQRAEAGAKVFIHHQGWMRNGGSNTYPPADYIPRDPADLKRAVDRLHARGLRVLLYMRGVEAYALNMPYWEQLLKRDLDGLYVDWNSPLNCRARREQQACFKPWDDHFFAYDYFRYTLMLRKRVGDGGVLVGHSNAPVTFLAHAAFDAYLGGEYEEQKEHLCDNLDSWVHYGLKNCCGAAIIHYVPPVERAQALSAATGASAQNERGPLQRMLASVPMERVRLYDSLTENLKVLAFDRRGFHGCVYRISREQCLIVVANLSSPAAAMMTIDMPALGLVGRYKVTRLSALPDKSVKASAAGLTSGSIRVQRLAVNESCAYKLDRLTSPARARGH